MQINRRCPTITYLQFADDTLIFAKAEIGEIQKWRDILQRFAVTSGLQINFEKSSIVFNSQVLPDLKQQVLNIMQCRESSGSGMYLGVPALWGKSKREALGYVVDGVKAKAQGWKEKLLSSAGK